jgi:hypothetical protein
MTVYYFEGSPIVAPLTIESNFPIFMAETVSLKQQRASQGAQRWELSFNLQDKGTEADFLVSMVTNLTTARTMIMPQLNEVNSKVTVTLPGIAGATAAGVSTVFIDFNQVGILPKGSFIKFNNHAKIYMVTSTVNTQTTPVPVNIFPSLRKAVTAGTNVYHPGSSVKPVITFYQSMDTISGITYEDGVLMNPGTINILEAL